TKADEGPTQAHPEWIQLGFSNTVRGLLLKIRGRPGHGPRECDLQVSSDGKPTTVKVDDANAAFIRIAVLAAYDGGSPGSPRNVQIAEVSLIAKDHAL